MYDTETFGSKSIEFGPKQKMSSAWTKIPCTAYLLIKWTSPEDSHVLVEIVKISATFVTEDFSVLQNCKKKIDGRLLVCPLGLYSELA